MLGFVGILMQEIKGADVIARRYDFMRTIKTCGMSENQNLNKVQHFSYLNYVLKQSKIKSNSKSIILHSLGCQLYLIIFTSYFAKDKWWPPLLCALFTLGLATVHYRNFPYVKIDSNYVPIATNFTLTFGFIRTSISNMTDNEIVNQIAAFEVYLTPLIFITFWILAAIKANKEIYSKTKGELVYNESDDFDLIETDSNRSSTSTKQLKKIVIEKIMSLKVDGVRAKTLRVDSIMLNDTNKLEIIAHGVFSVENSVGLYNCLVLLSHLWKEDNIYFSKISFFNIQFYYKDLSPLMSKSIELLQYALMSKIFWYLKHFEMHNFVFYKDHFLLLMKILEFSPTIEVLDFYHNQVVEFNQNLKMASFWESMEKMYASVGEIFKIDEDTKYKMCLILKANPNIRKVIISMIKTQNILDEF